MLFKTTLTVALLLFGIGLIHRVDAWFLRTVGTGDRSVPVSRRFGSGLKGLLGVLFSSRILPLLRSILVDVLLQARILRDVKDRLAWVMHLSLFFGFLLLVVFHALGSTFWAVIDPGYQPTLNPYLFLRNLSGALLVIGLGLAVFRRLLHRTRIRTTAVDVWPIALLALIVVSGFLLEGLKITSQREFQAMVEENGGDVPETEIADLEAFWVSEYGLISAAVKQQPGAEVLARGQELHELNCLGCHSRPQAAFVSYPLSRLLLPAAALDRLGGVTVLWAVHFLACFAGLAYLAFGKMFHIISTPVSLLVAALARPSENPAATATRQVIELDGCSHGGACHEACPVRQRRMERIENAQPYRPMFDYVGGKSAAELGSRVVSE